MILQKVGVCFKQDIRNRYGCHIMHLPKGSGVCGGVVFCIYWRYDVKESSPPA